MEDSTIFMEASDQEFIIFSQIKIYRIGLKPWWFHRSRLPDSGTVNCSKNRCSMREISRSDRIPKRLNFATGLTGMPSQHGGCTVSKRNILRNIPFLKTNPKMTSGTILFNVWLYVLVWGPIRGWNVASPEATTSPPNVILKFYGGRQGSTLRPPVKQPLATPTALWNVS